MGITAPIKAAQRLALKSVDISPGLLSSKMRQDPEVLSVLDKLRKGEDVRTVESTRLPLIISEIQDYSPGVLHEAGYGEAGTYNEITNLLRDSPGRGYDPNILVALRNIRNSNTISGKTKKQAERLSEAVLNRDYDFVENNLAGFIEQSYGQSADAVKLLNSLTSQVSGNFNSYRMKRSIEDPEYRTKLDAERAAVVNRLNEDSTAASDLIDIEDVFFNEYGTTRKQYKKSGVNPKIAKARANILAAFNADPERVSKAQSLGFRTDEVWFHGGTGGTERQGIGSFLDKYLGKNTGAKSAKMGTWMSSSPATALGYASAAAHKTEGIVHGSRATYPLLVKYKNPFVVDAQGKNYSELGEGVLSRTIKKAKADGHDAVIFRNFTDVPGNEDVADHLIMLNSEGTMRLPWAKFDAHAWKSPRLLASLAASAGVAGSMVPGGEVQASEDTSGPESLQKAIEDSGYSDVESVNKLVSMMWDELKASGEQSSTVYMPAKVEDGVYKTAGNIVAPSTEQEKAQLEQYLTSQGYSLTQRQVEHITALERLVGAAERASGQVLPKPWLDNQQDQEVAQEPAMQQDPNGLTPEELAAVAPPGSEVNYVASQSQAPGEISAPEGTSADPGSAGLETKLSQVVKSIGKKIPAINPDVRYTSGAPAIKVPVTEDPSIPVPGISPEVAYTSTTEDAQELVSEVNLDGEEDSLVSEVEMPGSTAIASPQITNTVATYAAVGAMREAEGKEEIWDIAEKVFQEASELRTAEREYYDQQEKEKLVEQGQARFTNLVQRSPEIEEVQQELAVTARERNLLGAEFIPAIKSAFPAASAADVETQAALLALGSLIQEKTDQGVESWVADFIPMLLPGYSISDFFMTDTSEEDISRFRSLPPGEIYKEGARLLEMIQDQSGILFDNNLAALGQISNYISPQGESDYRAAAYLEGLFGVADAVGVGQVMRGVKAATRPPIAAALVKDRAALKVLMDSAMASKKAAEAMNFSRVGAVQAVSPTQPQGLLGASTGVSPVDQYFSAVEALVKASMDSFNSAGRKAIDELDILSPEIYSPEELARAETRVLDIIQKDVDAATENFSGSAPLIIENLGGGKWRAHATGSDYELDVGTSPLNFGATGKTIQFERTYVAGLNDVGDFELREFGGVRSFTLSPKQLFRPAGEEGTVARVVENAELLGHNRPIVAQRFQDLYDEAVRPIGKLNFRRTRRVNEVLRLWDRKNVRPSISDLVAGIADEAGKTHRLTDPREIQTYYNMLEISDFAFDVNNRLTRAAKQVEGWAGHDLRGLSANVIIKPYSTPQEINGVLNVIEEGTKNTRILEWGQGKTWTVQGVRNRVKADPNLVVAKLSEPRKMKSGKYYQHVLIHRDLVKDLPDVVVSKRAAYVPKINELARGVIKEIPKSFVVDGISKVSKAERAFSPDARVIRFIESSDQAERIIKELEAQNPGKEYTFNLDDDYRFSTGSATFNSERGPFRNGRRAVDDITFGALQQRSRTTPPLEAIARNLQHLSNQYPAAEWRVATTEKFFRAIEAAHAVRGETWNRGVAKLTDRNLIDPKLNNAVALERMRDYLVEQFRIPTYSEISFQRLANQIAKFIDGVDVLGYKGYKSPKAQALKNMFYLAADKDPIAAIKNAVFHTLLGFFNPAQLWIQAQSAVIPFTLEFASNPLTAVRSVSRWYAARTGYFTKGTNTSEFLAKAAFMKQDEFADYMDRVRQTGLLESTMNHGDYSVAASGGTYGMDTLRKFANSGTILYSEGERFSRLIAWDVARNRYLRSSKKTWKQLTDDDYRKIFSQGENLRLNMSAANKARHQKGIWSVPTQFMQAQRNFFETVFTGSRGFTGVERFKIFVGQVALYGAAGVPLGKAVLDQFPAIMPEGWDEQDLAVARQGLMGWVFGGENEIAGRSALAGDIERTLLQFLSADAKIRDVLLGASATVLDRGGKTVAALAPFVGTHTVAETSIEEQGTAFLKLLGGNFASTRNALEAYEQHTLLAAFSEGGDFLYNIAGTSDAAIKALGLGFQLTRKQALSTAILSARQQDEYVQKQAAKFTNLWLDYLVATGVAKDGDGNVSYDEVKAKTFLNALRMEIYAHEQKNPHLAGRIIETMTNNIQMQTGSSETRLAEELNRLVSEGVELNLPEETVLQNNEDSQNEIFGDMFKGEQ